MAKLYYFDGRGKGEIIRLTLAAAGIQFTEEFVSDRETFLNWIKEGRLLFSQLPLLEIDGKKLVQTNSTVRYLGRKAGLVGKNEDEAVLVDIYFEGGRDFMSSCYQFGFVPDDEVLKNIKEKAFPRYLPVFEKIAAANGTGFLVGSSLTLADLSLLEPLLICVEYLGTDIFKDYPALKKLYENLTSMDRIAAFLKGPQRKRKNDARYVSDVKTTLGWN